ncbi:MAG: hypothetical protein WCX61_04155 [Candidatus Peribacteraceae bacterium]|jgi:hypothetical protein
MRYSSIQSTVAVLTFSLMPLSALAYSTDLFVGDPFDAYDTTEELEMEQQIDAQCREEIGLPGGDLPFGSQRFQLRRCINTKQKEQANILRAEKRKVRTATQYQTKVLPKAEALKRRTTSFFRRTLQQKTDQRDAFRSALPQNATERTQWFETVRSRNRLQLQTQEQKILLDERELMRLKQDARKLCRNMKGQERADCITDELERLQSEAETD